MNAQIEQLRKEIADKQKQLETLEQFPYKKGQLVYIKTVLNSEWVSEFDNICETKFVNTSTWRIDKIDNYGHGHLCDISEITTHRLATEADLNRLPDGHKWKQKKLPTTIEEVCEVVKPSWYLAFTTNEILKGPASPSSSSTQQNAERVRAYNNLLNVIEWGNREWPEDDEKSTWYTGLPIMNRETMKHIRTYFSNDLKTFQS